MARTAELVRDIGKEWFVVAIGAGAGIYGAAVLIASSRVSGWLWVAVCFSLVSFVAVRLAFRFQVERDRANSERDAEPKRVLHEVDPETKRLMERMVETFSLPGSVSQE